LIRCQLSALKLRAWLAIQRLRKKKVRRMTPMQREPHEQLLRLKLAV
jgi:hypothetical protein